MEGTTIDAGFFTLFVFLPASGTVFPPCVQHNEIYYLPRETLILSSLELNSFPTSEDKFKKKNLFVDWITGGEEDLL